MVLGDTARGDQPFYKFPPGFLLGLHCQNLVEHGGNRLADDLGELENLR